jgi:hypothetical protein
MAERVCVFVDGENFRHSVVDLFPSFRQQDYLPRNANWQELFDWIVQQASDDGRRVRTYWYVVEHLDCRPFRLPHITHEREGLKKALGRDSQMKQELDAAKDEAEVSKTPSRHYSRLNNRRGSMKKRFEGWKTVHDAIARNHSAIEFRTAGSLRYDLFDDSLGPEKAVDVKLATDLLMLRDIYDVAVIVSGDQDYVPAVEVVKDGGKRVINAAFKTRNGKLLPGGAMRLNQTTDWNLQIPYRDLKTHLNL